MSKSRRSQAAAGSRFELRAIKLFIDGAMGSRGGLLFQALRRRSGQFRAALDRSQGARGDDDGRARAWLAGLHSCDRRQGQRAGARRLRRRAQGRSRRHATLGCGSSTPRSCGRRTSRGSLELGVIASMQPSHASDDMRWADARLGPGRVDGAYAWRWFADAGVPLAYGSDFPVEIVSPCWGIYAAVTRARSSGQAPRRLASRTASHARGDPQRLHGRRRLRGLCRGSGSVFSSRGLRADLTIVDRDLFLVEQAPTCSQLAFLMTIIDGAVAYRRRQAVEKWQPASRRDGSVAGPARRGSFISAVRRISGVTWRILGSTLASIRPVAQPRAPRSRAWYMRVFPDVFAVAHRGVEDTALAIMPAPR